MEHSYHLVLVRVEMTGLIRDRRMTGRPRVRTRRSNRQGRLTDRISPVRRAKKTIREQEVALQNKRLMNG